jgi:hypothetical protein
MSIGHGVFDLDAGVDLDEVELLGVHIHQELDRSRTFVVDVGTDALGHLADVFALLLGQVGRRGTFDDLLVPPLHGAVTLPQVPAVALLVTKDLHLDMAGALDHLFQIALAVAESGLSLAPALTDLRFQFFLVQDRTHPPPAAAPGGFQHQRIADFLGLFLDEGHVLAQHFRRRDDRDTRLHRDAAGRSLVAQGAHGFRPRPDEGDPRLIAGIDEIRVLGQETIARMNRIRPRHPCDPDDLGDAQIGPDGRHPLADPVGLVRLEAVKAQLVFLGIDRDGLLAHLVGRPQGSS